MKNIKVAACALNQTPLDWEGNYNRIIQAIDEAYDENVAVLCLPELCITGYSLEDLFFAKEVHKKSLEYLDKISFHIGKKDRPMIVSVGLPYFINGSLYNVAAMLYWGQIKGLVPKQNLANDGVHYESRWFKPGIVGEVFNSHLTNVDFGDLIFDFNGIKIGFEICEDAWVTNRSGSRLAEKAVDIILNPSASHFAFGKHKVREQLVIEGSRAFKCAYIYSNLLGNEAGRVIFEGDTMIASGGKLIASGPRMSFKDVILTTAVIDIDHIKTLQVMNGSFHHTKEPYYTIQSYNDLTICDKLGGNKLLAEDLNKYDEFIFAESLGLFDYMRKSHSNGFVLSISGGCDSAVCACLIKFMHDRGIQELGLNKFEEKSGIKFNPEQDLMPQLLTCIYQATENSSEETLLAAKTVAEGIGATFINWNLNDILSSYTKKVELAVGRNLTWDTDDITLQNIQARIRVPGLWMIANINQSILLCTSNRSETAVGYCTADGDLSGSLSPVAGVSKEFLLDWLKCIYNMENNPLISSDYELYYGKINWLDCLRLVMKQKPTAELRPSSNLQLDEKDLMPYDVLDFIEQRAILEKKFPYEVLECLCGKYNGRNDNVFYDLDTLKAWTNKFFKLWQRNQWKRERASVSFMLDNESLDPKSWCRSPVLSAKFEEV